MNRERLARIGHLILWLPIAIYALQVASTFFHYADGAVRLSTDDALANISYALATEGRYGFLSSPVLLDIPRDHGLFSYGPFYFYVAAALIWVFGYSLTLVRAIHLGVILSIVIAGRAWFGRAAAGAAGAITAVGLLFTFERGQWPMVRPDSMVSFFAVAMVIAAGLAVRSGSGWYWAATGFAAACGAFTHLVAWSLIPSAAVICGLTMIASARRDDGGWQWPAGLWLRPLALAAGGAAGTFVFYASFGFRLGDQLRFLAGYQDLTGSMSAMSGPGFRSVLLQHFRLSYWYVPYPLEYAVWATLLAGVTAVAVLLVRGEPAWRQRMLVLVAPPIVVWVNYLLSLGVYNNFHSGYAMLNQVMWLWCVGALIAAVLSSLDRWPRLLRAATAATWLVAAGLSIGVVTLLGQRTEYRALAAGASVSIDEYIGRVLEPLPAGARTWGTVVFGIEHPGRVQLIQFDDALTLTRSLGPAERALAAPDFLIWGFTENRESTLGVLTGSEALPRTLSRLFPDVEYDLVSMTAGAPYGVTRVFARKGSPMPDQPTVTSYDSRYRRWNRALSALTPLTTAPAPAVQLRLGSEGTATGYRAVQTVSANAPAATYLLRVQLTPEAPADLAAVFLASPVLELRDTFGEYGPEFDTSAPLAREKAAYLLYRHPGGPIYISQFGTGPAAIAGVQASRLLSLVDYGALRRQNPVEQPMLASQWIHPNTLVPPNWPDQPEIRLTSGADNTTVVDGNAIQYGYQAYGPKIPVEPFQYMRIRFAVTIVSGTACLGVLDGTGMSWLVVPDKLQAVYEFQINDSDTVKPVLANCSSSPTGIIPIKAVIGPGSYALWSEREEPYTDLLMRMFTKTSGR